MNYFEFKYSVFFLQQVVLNELYEEIWIISIYRGRVEILEIDIFKIL